MTIRVLQQLLVNSAKEDLLRPVVILVCAMLLFHLPTLCYKLRLAIRAVLYFLGCWDKSWNKPADPGSIFGPHLSQGLAVERKTIYFVRHGESTWNDTFNKGNHRSTAAFVIGFIPGLIKALWYELYLLLSGKIDRYGNLHAERAPHSLYYDKSHGNALSFFWMNYFQLVL